MESKKQQDLYRQLAKKWLDGSITAEEKKTFSLWYNSIEDSDLHVPENFSLNEEELKLRILNKVKRNNKNAPVHHLIKNLYRIAAAIILITGSIFILHYFVQPEPKPQLTESKLLIGDTTVNNDLMPGGDKAILTLADGTEIVLDEQENGLIVVQGTTKIIKKEDGQIRYKSEDGFNTKPVYNTVKTPRGGQYRIELPDKSVVWMNAASSIRFPTCFTGAERKVSVNGELYFDVHTDPKRPFVIDVNGSLVQALGTEFNVMAYANEGSVITTLVSGRVRVRHGKKSADLKPGQQSLFQHSGNIELQQTSDQELVTAWKNGYTSFRNADLESIMRQVERWYDVDVDFDKNLEKRYFTGDISRNARLNEFLNVLNQSGVRFKLEGRKIKVRK